MAHLLIQANARTLPLADESVHACITSIPYWGLRTYGTDPQVWGGTNCLHEWGEWREQHSEREETSSGKSRTTERFYGDESRKFNGNHQKHTAGAFCRLCSAWSGELGLEPTPELFVAHIVEVFREVRRVLRKDGVLWLNIGDSYASAPNGRSAAATKDAGKDDRTFRDKPFSTVGYKGTRGASPKHAKGADLEFEQPNRMPQASLKPKDLVGMPWRVALALQADGWWLRSDCIWSKKNPLPSSVKDRPAMSHEYVFMLTRAERYYYDHIAVREPAKYGPRIHAPSASRKYHEGTAPKNPHSLYFAKTSHAPDPGAGRNLRTVWNLATEPISAKRFGADVEHFAAFPTKLVEPCILASPERVCAKCGAPWERVLKPTEDYAEHFGSNNGADSNRNGKGYRKHSPAISAQYQTVAWKPTCRCHCSETRPAVILDNFCGSATTGVVALRHGRDFVGVDLSHAYLSGLAAKRIAHSLTAAPKKPKKPSKPKPDQMSLKL